MKNVFRTAAMLSLLLVAALSATAQNDQKKTEQFNKIAKLTQSQKLEDKAKAYDLSKEFLSQYGKNAEDDQVKKITEFFKRQRTAVFIKNLDDVKIAEAYVVGKEILADEPENAYIFINMAYGGFQALDKKKDKTYAADAVNYAKQALALLEAGKAPTSYEPFKDQAEATALMYYIIGSFAFESDPHLAAVNFYKALQYESQIKNNSYSYYVLAFNYEKEYEKLAKEYQAKLAAKAPETEMIKLQDKLMLVVDRMLDSYARAIKFADAGKESSLASWKQRFNDIYKYRNQTDAGAAEFLNSATTKPLPDPNTL